MRDFCRYRRPVRRLAADVRCRCDMSVPGGPGYAVSVDIIGQAVVIYPSSRIGGCGAHKIPGGVRCSRRSLGPMATGKMEEAEQMDESPMRPSVKWAADTKAGVSSFCQITGLPSCILRVNAQSEKVDDRRKGHRLGRAIVLLTPTVCAVRCKFEIRRAYPSAW
jgi:hypothetical protein